VALHVLNTLLLFGLLRMMTGALWRSAFVAALFAVHPAHVESVAWVAERKDLLAGCFWLLTTWAYVDWVRQPDARRYGLIVLTFALGLMSKPMLVTLPFTLLLLDFWPLERTSVSWARKVVEKLPLVALAVVSSVITFVVQQRGGAVGTLELIPMSDRVANAIVSYGRYLKMLVWPTDLAVLYPYVFNLPASSVIVAAVTLVVITAVAWWLRRSQPFLIVGWLWFLGTLVPVIGLVQVGVHALADRYTYLPYVGLLVAVAWSGRHVGMRLHLTSAFLRLSAVVIVIVAAVVAHAQVATWESSEGIWLQAALSTKNNARAHNALGVIYGNAGHPEDAVLQFREALRLKPDISDARNIYPNLGRALMAQGQVQEAIPYLERAAELNPTIADTRHQLALAYFTVRRNAEAITSWREAVRLDPQFEDAYFTMGMVLAGDRRIEEARRAFAEVLRINPGRKDARQALEGLGGR
jgi:tetratricopeptide (TPR) repeat protein